MLCMTVGSLYTLARSRIMLEYRSPSPEVRRHLPLPCTFLLGGQRTEDKCVSSMVSSLQGIYYPAGSESTETSPAVAHHSAPPTSSTPNTVAGTPFSGSKGYMLGRKREPVQPSD